MQKPDYLIIPGDIRTVELPSESCHMAITSPPYYRQWVYGEDPNEIGNEPTLDAYIANVCDGMDRVRDALVEDGFLFFNIGDKSNNSGGAGGDFLKGGERANRKPYGKTGTAETGLKGSQLIGVPWRVAFELQNRGWMLRADVIWNRQKLRREDPRHVRRPIPQHEYVFIFAKSKKSNKRWNPEHGFELGSVWNIDISDRRSEGKAPPFPDELVRRAIVATTQPGEVVLDPFVGHGTTVRVARNLGRRAIGVDLYPELVD